MTTRPHASSRNEHVFESRESELDRRRGDPSAWLALDSVYLADGGGPQRVARLCGRARRDPEEEVTRSFAIVGRPGRPHVNDVDPPAGSAPTGDMCACGRRYSLALLALLDALAAEPPRSPLATASPLDDLRATAFLVAGATVADHPNLSLIERVVQRADRRLMALQVPLRTTGYLAARDALRHLVAPHLVAPGGTP